jgi:hypothetical protein
MLRGPANEINEHNQIGVVVRDESFRFQSPQLHAAQAFQRGRTAFDPSALPF